MTLTTTPLDHHLDLADGRSLAVREVGDPAGPAVVLLSSAPGSRAFDPDPAVTRAAGVRLVTLDRPGYGASSPLAPGTAPSLAAMADDVAATLDALDIADAGVVGWSTGGRVALGVAARHAERVRAAALVGTPAPDEHVPWIPDEHRGLLASLRDDPAGGVEVLVEIFGPMGEAMAADVTQVAPADADARLLEDPVVRDRVLAMLAEALRPGVRGLATDIVAANVAEPGFDATSVGAPVSLVYGGADDLVSPVHGDWWAGELAAPTQHVVADAGHLVVVDAWAEILAGVR